MPTFRRFVCSGAITFANQWSAQDGGDAVHFIFTEGAWVYGWQGYWKVNPAGSLGAQITATLGTFYEVPLPENSGTPPVIILKSAIQALVDGGASIVVIGGSIGGTAPGDSRISMSSPSTPTTIDQLAAMQWTLTTISATAFPELTVTFAVGNLRLSIPDPPPPFILIGSGGVGISGGVIGQTGQPIPGFFAFSGFPVGPMIILIGSGGIKINSGASEVLSKDISGIYTLIANKTNDILYNRTTGGSVTSLVVKIPNPFIKSGYIGN